MAGDSGESKSAAIGAGHKTIGGQFIDERTTHMSLALVSLVALVLGKAEPPLNLLRGVAHLGQSLRAPVGKCDLNG